MKAVSDEDIAAYHADGAIAVREVLDSKWLARLREAVEDDIRSPGPFYHGYDSDEGMFHGNLRLWQHHACFREICLDSHLPQLAQSVLQSRKINLLYDQLFVKESSMSQRTRWHNDQPYWPVSGTQVISIWLAMDKTTAENGRVEFIRGSHLWNKWYQPEPFGKTQAINGYERNPDYEDIPDIEANREDYDIISWDLEPGDAFIFSAMTVHGAGGSQLKDRRRRGYTVRYTGDDVRYDKRLGTSKPLHNEALSDGDELDSELFPLLIST